VPIADEAVPEAAMERDVTVNRETAVDAAVDREAVETAAVKCAGVKTAVESTTMPSAVAAAVSTAGQGVRRQGEAAECGNCE
jgi:hypothetical protein